MQAFVEQALPSGERVAIERHVETCATCRDLVAVLASGVGTPPSVAPSGDTLPAPAAVMPLLEGTAIDRFVIRGRLGAGGMGVVYAAHDPELDRMVALKLLRNDATEARARLTREAQALARVAHPNVCAIYDIGSAGDRAFIAMEMIEGETLAAWLRARRRPLREVLDRFIDAGRGLVAAHAAGVLHRDFKPDNVLCGRDGRIRVTDFGLASWQAGEAPGEPRAVARAGSDSGASPSASAPRDLTRTGAVVGTPLYMSPEQHAGGAVDAASDQFSFCVALWEAVYGTRPFLGRTYEQLRDAVQRGAPEPPAGDGPRWLARILRRGLEVAPERRFPSMAALVAALERGRARPRRLALGAAVGGLAAVAIGAAVTAAVGATAADALCTGGRARLSGIWDGARRGRVEAAFRAAGPTGVALWPRIAGELDGYGAELATMVEDNCRATRVRGTQPDDVMQLRSLCLDQRASGLRALVDQLETADVAAIERTLSSIERLPPVASCANATALTAPDRPPRDPAAAARIAAVQDQLARGRALSAVGREPEAAAALRAAVGAADAAGYRPLMAEARIALGEVQLNLFASREAEATLHEAIRHAEAGHDGLGKSQAAVLLVDALAYSGKEAEAEQWAGYAAAALEGIGGDDALAADLDEIVGRYGEGDAAVAALGRARDRRIRLYGESSLEVGKTLSLQALAYARDGKLDDAEALRKRAAAVFAGIPGIDEPRAGAELLGKSTTAMMAGRFDEAAALSQQFIDVLGSLRGAAEPAVALAEINLSFAYVGGGHYREALDADRRAIAILDANGDRSSLLAQALTEAGLNAVELGQARDAIAYLERALSIAEPLARSDDPMLSLALTGLGRARLAAGDAAGALGPLERALAWRLAHADVPAIQLGSTQFALAQAIWQSRGDRARARALAADAVASMARHRDRFATATGAGATAREAAIKKLSEIEAWRAAHR